MKISVSKSNTFISEIDFRSSVVKGQEAHFFIGRSKDCHIYLDDQMISRQQCKIHFDGNRWFLRNLNDSNIIYYQGQIFLDSAELIENAKLVINDFIIIFSAIQKFEENPTSSFLNTTQARPTHDISLTQTEAKDATGVFEDAAVEEDDSGPPTEVPSNDFNSAVEGDNLGELDASFNESELTQSNQTVDDGMNALDNYDEYADSSEVDAYDDVGEGTRILGGFAKFSLELFGEFAPYDTFNIEDREVFIGRDAEKCKIVLQDPEVSAVHAVIRKNNITCTLEDLKSANGTILNGKRINSKEITNGDEFIIGGTTFTVKVGSEFIDSQKDMLMPVEENQTVEVEEILEMSEEDFDGIEEVPTSTSQSLFSRDALRDPQKRKKLIYIVSGILLLYMFLDESEPAKPTVDPKKDAKEKVVDNKDKPEEAKLTPEQAELIESLYQLGQAFLVEGKYPEAINEFDKLMAIKKDYKETVQLYQLAKEKLAQLEKAELERRAEEEKALKRKKVAEILAKAEIAVKERNVTVAESLFLQIREIDPDNYDVTNLEIDLNAWKKEKAEKEMAEIQKQAERKRMVDALSPGKALYLKEEWYRAAGELEKFLAEKNMDEDLIKDATDMLKASKEKLSEVVDPLLGKARSLKEGEDLKGAYAVYLQVLKFDPTSAEALNEMDDIKFTLTSRARKIYREAIVAESLGLFEKAKEKFQEIQQTTPDDNEYFRKASDRLRDL